MKSREDLTGVTDNDPLLADAVHPRLHLAYSYSKAFFLFSTTPSIFLSA